MAIGQAEQDPNLSHSANNVWAEPSQCNSLLFNRVEGQAEVPAGQVNLRGSFPCSASNVLEPMLHPALDQLLLNYRMKPTLINLPYSTD